MTKKTTIELESLLKSCPEERISSVVEDLCLPTLVDYIHTLILEKNRTSSDIIQKTTLQRNYAYQILNGLKSNPGRDKVLQLILSLGCTLDEANRLLTLSHNEVLYAKNKRDALLIYCISNKISVFRADELLTDHGFFALE